MICCPECAHLLSTGEQCSYSVHADYCKTANDPELLRRLRKHPELLWRLQKKLRGLKFNG